MTKRYDFLYIIMTKSYDISISIMTKSYILFHDSPRIINKKAESKMTQLFCFEITITKTLTRSELNKRRAGLKVLLLYVHSVQYYHV